MSEKRKQSKETLAAEREEALLARVERAKAMVRLELLVIRAECDRLNEEETEALLRAHRHEYALSGNRSPLGVERASLWRLRVHLGLVTGRQWEATGKRTGRRDTKAKLEAQS